MAVDVVDALLCGVCCEAGVEADTDAGVADPAVAELEAFWLRCCCCCWLAVALANADADEEEAMAEVIELTAAAATLLCWADAAIVDIRAAVEALCE